MNNSGSYSGVQTEGIQAEGRSSEHFSLQPEYLQSMLPLRV